LCESADEEWRKLPLVSPFPGCGRPIRAFTDPARAAEVRDEMERKAREGKNPFEYGRSFKERTSMPAQVFRDWLADAGLTPPEVYADGRVNWRVWWTTNEPGMTAFQRAKVWEALDRVRFYSVVALEPPSR
jgi:hypothetical protein